MRRRWGSVVGFAAVLGVACGEAEGDPPADTDAAQTEGGTDEPSQDDSSEPAEDDDASAGETPGDPSGPEDDGDEEGGSTETGNVDPTDAGCEIGTTPSSEVVTIGDSYLAATRVVVEIEVAARLNGSLDPQEGYRRYERSGTQMGNGQIPGQFTTAVTEDAAINTVIMTGGGNDVLSGSASGCLQNPPPAESCVTALDAVISTAEALIADMAAAGVAHVVYHFYPHLPPGFPPGAKNETLDYAAPLIAEACESAPGIDCHFVDIRDAFEGHPEYISPDAIHPTDAGSAVIAELIWQTMVDNCIAQ